MNRCHYPLFNDLPLTFDLSLTLWHLLFFDKFVTWANTVLISRKLIVLRHSVELKIAKPFWLLSPGVSLDFKIFSSFFNFVFFTNENSCLLIFYFQRMAELIKVKFTQPSNGIKGRWCLIWSFQVVYAKLDRECYFSYITLMRTPQTKKYFIDCSIYIFTNGKINPHMRSLGGNHNREKGKGKT